MAFDSVMRCRAGCGLLGCCARAAFGLGLFVIMPCRRALLLALTEVQQRIGRV